MHPPGGGVHPDSSPIPWNRPGLGDILETGIDYWLRAQRNPKYAVDG